MANRFWVGGTATWNATVGTKWASVSGGAGGASVPSATDDVFFDGIATGGGAAGAIVVTVGANSNAKNLNFTGFAGTFTGASQVALAGTLVMVNTMICTFTGLLLYTATSAQNITLGGRQLAAVTFNGVAGIWTLLDAFSITGQLTLTNGDFEGNGKAVTCSVLSSSNGNARTLSMGGGIWTLTGTATVWGTANTTGLTFNQNGSTIKLTDATAAARIISPGGLLLGPVLVTAGSGNLTLTAFNCTDFDCTGYTGQVQTSGFTIRGKWVNDAGTTYAATANAITLAATSGTNAITSNGCATIDRPVTMDGVGGTWQLTDDFAIGTTRVLNLVNGAFDANNHKVTFGLWSSSNANIRSVTMGSNTWHATGVGIVWGTIITTNMTFNAGTSTIKIDDASAADKQFNSGGLIFNNIYFSGVGTGSFIMQGINTFNNLTMDTPPHTLKFDLTVPTIATLSSISIFGTAGNLMTLTTTSSATATLLVAGNDVICDYLSISKLIAAGGARWFAGRHSVDGGTNQGWRFTDRYRSPVMNNVGFVA